VWLESKYGKKGKPKPDQTRETDSRTSKETARTKVDAGEQNAFDDRRNREPTEHKASDGNYLPDDVEFLKERIRTLEREKLEESKRNENRETMLFAQLAVKDKQISSWDELTQGIMKGLATGRLQPMLDTGVAPGGEREPRRHSAASHEEQDANVVTTTPAATTKPRSQKGTGKKPQRKKPANKKPPKWYEMPTIKNVLSRH
jgi:hypothetical protein